MVFAGMFVGLIGIVFVVIGYLLWEKQRISLLHDYHYDKVSEENKKAFCTLSGIGVTIIGVGLLITGIVVLITDSVWSFLAFAIGFAIGMAVLSYAGIRYNR